MTADDIIAACGEGRGDEIGLPALNDPDELKTNIIVARAMMSNVDLFDGPIEMLIDASTRCSECGQHPDALDDTERALHEMAGAYVLIGCEGYHTPLLRVVRAMAEPDAD